MNRKLREGIVAAGSAFFGALVGITAAGAWPEGLWAAFVAAGIAFFASMGGNGVANHADR